MKEWKLPYTFSRDYELMKRLLDEGYELVCYVDNRAKEYFLRCICRARKIDDKYSASSCGVEFVSYSDRIKWGYSSLEEALSECNLEFIVPNLEER